MSEEKDFFKTCFNTVASLEVTNESQAIAKEVVLNEIEQLKQENKQLKEIYKELFNTYQKLKKENEEVTSLNLHQVDKIQQLEDNWNELKEYIRKTKLKEFEKSYGKRYGKTFTQAEVIVCNMITNKMQELEQGSDSNEKDN